MRQWTLVALVALALAGCGKNDEQDSSTPVDKKDPFTMVYNFDDLKNMIGLPLYNQDPSTPVMWDSVNASNRSAVCTALEPSGNVYLSTNARVAEQLISRLSDAGNTLSLFKLKQADRKFRLSWDGKVNAYAGYIVGIWIDGIDEFPNTATTNELEHGVQFGTDYQYQTFRVRGVNDTGSPYTKRGTLGLPPAPDLAYRKLVLDLDLDANSGDGLMSLTVIDAGGIEYKDPALQNAAMGLSRTDANGVPYATIYGDPSKWTGWYVRNGRADGGDNPKTAIGYHTLDNLTLQIVH